MVELGWLPNYVHEVLISTFLWTVKAKQKSFRHLLEVAAAHSDCKRWCWIFHARSDFWWEKLRGGGLCKFTSMWVVDLSALAMLASIIGFILRCFQRGECSGAVTTSSWSWQENHASTISHNLIWNKLLRKLFWLVKYSNILNVHLVVGIVWAD